MKKLYSILTVITILLTLGVPKANASLQTADENDSTAIAPDSILQKMTRDELEAYFDSIYRAGHPLLDTICNEEPLTPGKHRIKRQDAFPYYNNYVPSTASVSTQKAVGQIDIQSGISPSGAKTYTVPIKSYKFDDVFSPDISLSYNSQGGGSRIGKGWSVGGLQCIVRGNKTVHYDGSTEGMKMKPDDAFYLNGMRLVRTSTTAYEYQSEQGNIKAVASVSGDVTKTFTVYFPNGCKATFGYSFFTSNNLEYPMTSLTDERGRTITYTYDSTNYNFRIKEISYDSSSAKILFTYDETRADNVLGYRGGLWLDDGNLLKTITCKRGSETLGTYTLTYTTNDNTSLLTQIDYSAGGSSLNPLKFYYGDGTAQATYDTVDQSYAEGYLYTYRNQIRGVRGRFDYQSGDDALFIIPVETPYLLNTDGGNQKYFKNQYQATQKIYAYKNFGELLGGLLPDLKTEEGFVDLFCADLEGKQTEYVVKVNNTVSGNYDKITFKVYANSAVSGISLYKTRTYNLPTVCTDGSGNKSVQPKYYFPGDFDGDGKMEVLVVSADNPIGGSSRPSKCYIYDLINDTKLYEGQVFTLHKEFPTTSNMVYPENNSDKVLAIDVNGDGKTEVCHIGADGTTVYEFKNDNGTWTVGSIGNSSSPNRSSLVNTFYACGDFNGDGLCDILVSGIRDWSSSSWLIYPSRGDGTFTIKSMTGPNMSTSAASDFLVQDVDGDGITDLVELTSSQMKTYIIKNNNATLKNTVSLTYANEFIAPVSYNSSTLNYQLIGLHGYNANLYAYETKQTVDQALTGMVNSLGVIDKNYYYSISKDNNNIYYKSTTASFPYTNLFEGIAVLAGNEIFLNGGSKDINKYYYENAVLHRQGMGFCGFEVIKMQDKRGRYHTTTYAPYNHSVLAKTDTPEATVTYTNSVTTASDKTVKALVTSTTEYDKQKGTTATTAYTYDNYGQVLTANTTLPGSITVNKTYSYNNHTNIGSKYHLGVPNTTTVTTKRGNSQHTESTSVTSYNTNSQPLTIVEKTNGNTVKTTTLVYDTNGQVTSRTVKPYASTKTQTWAYTYSSKRLAKATEPVGTSKSYTYNNNGTVAKIATSYAGDTQYTYDAFGRETQQKNPDNTVLNTAFAWDSGNGGIYAITKSGTNMPTVTTVYDALNREVKTITTRFDGSKAMVVKTYDAYGDMNQESLPYKSSNPTFKQYTYDSYHRLTKKVEAGKTTTYTYTGLSTKVSDGTTYQTTTTDALGGVVSVADPAGTITYTLNGAGNPTRIVTPASSGTVTTTITYDTYGRRTAIADPSHGNTSYVYDAEGNVKQETNANSKTISYTYDDYGRLQKKTAPEFNTTYGYDNQNRLTSATSSNGTSTTYTYDGYSRLSSTKETGADSRWLQKDYTYANGRVSAVKYTSQAGVLTTENYTYANGYLKEVKLNGTTSIFNLTSENALCQTTGVTTGPLTRSYGFTTYGYPSSRSVTGGSQTYQNWTYTFNAATGNLTSRRNVSNNITENFTYDNLHRLTAFAGTAVGYDNNGNITSKGDVGSFAYGTSGKPYAVSEVTLTNSISAGTQTVSYCSFDRPSSVSDNGYTASFTYNGNYDRVKMLVTKNSATTLTRYYLGGCYEQDVTPSGTKEKLYLNGDYYSAPAVLIKSGSSSSVYYILRDHLGSITHVINASGTVMQQLSYDAWGRLRNTSTNVAYAPANEPTPYLGRGYCGHEHLTGLGLINMNARLYDPLLGRFLSADPYVQAPQNSQNFNRYSYCLNNPLVCVDEDGEFFFAIPFIYGIGNTIAHALRKDIKSVGDGIKYFTQGFMSGTLLSNLSANSPASVSYWATQAFVGSTGILASGLTKAFTGGNIGAGMLNSFKLFVGNFYLDEHRAWNPFYGVLQGVSRHSWESPQTLVGHSLSQYYNIIGKTSRVDYLGGATFSSFENSDESQGITIGNFINIWNIETIESDFDSYVNKNPLYMHEFGHYLDSRRWGPSYLLAIGLPSLISAANSETIPGKPYKTHNIYWTERRANRQTSDYFWKYYGTDFSIYSSRFPF